MRSGPPEVLVVGGGVAGASVALELAARGADVTVLDRPEAGRATGAAAGMLAPQYEGEADDPLYRLGTASREIYPHFVGRVSELSGEALGHRSDGMLVANRSPEETRAARSSLERQREAGQSGELLEPDRARDLDSAASPRPHSYLWLPDEGQVDAQRLPAALHAALRTAGATLRDGACVRAVTDGRGGAGVRLEDGERLEADAVVVAAGAWTSRIDALPRALGIRPVKGQMVRLAPAEPLPPPLLADHHGHYVVPREDGTAVAGSTMEEAGYDPAPDEQVVEALVEEAARLAPALTAAARRDAWAGLRPVARDGRPVIGPDPGRRGLFYATGYGRHGILLAPLAARAVAELILEGETDVEWRPFSPERLPEV